MKRPLVLKKHLRIKLIYAEKANTEQVLRNGYVDGKLLWHRTCYRDGDFTLDFTIVDNYSNIYEPYIWIPASGPKILSH